MRIIGGRLRGLRLNPPNDLPVRPTTDLAKEALFNILQNQLDWEGLKCLDLCCGTGNISFELASRGVQSVDAVDLHMKFLLYIKDMCKKHGIDNVVTGKADMFQYIHSCKKRYDFIFTDPPYDVGQLSQLPKLIFERGLLTEGGLLVVEHPSMRKMVGHPAFVETRKYGYSSFSFYQN